MVVLVILVVMTQSSYSSLASSYPDSATIHVFDEWWHNILIALLVMHVGLTIVAIVLLWLKGGQSQSDTLAKKVFWVLVVLCLPVCGIVFFFCFGTTFFHGEKENKSASPVDASITPSAILPSTAPSAVTIVAVPVATIV